jgi:uncharacterized protein (DUF1697 family)
VERTVLLLRGINVGVSNRVSMPQLRGRLGAAGFQSAQTYLQSGNVVVTADATAAESQALMERILREDFGTDVPVLTRTRDELAAVVAANPLMGVATDPKRYQVTFLSEELEPQQLEWIGERLGPDEEFSALGRELYAWHPGGIHKSKLAAAMGAKSVLGERLATARNWITVTTLLAMCDE